MKIFGTAFSLVLGAWRLRIAIDLDDETFGPPAQPVTSRYSSSEPRKHHISMRRS
jgi:hypothetical protein